METIQLTITDDAFRKIRNEVVLAVLGQNDSTVHLAWQLLLDAIEQGDTEITIRTREDRKKEEKNL